MTQTPILRVDLHTHTRHSHDSWTSVPELIRAARDAGIDRVAVTDHNVIEGAWEAKQLAPELVIVGQEVFTAERADVIGLYLRERVRPFMSVADTIKAIHDQGGVAYIPHPFAYLYGVKRRVEVSLAGADVVEGYNSRAFLPWWNARAIREARRRGIPIAAGSDAHFSWEIGRAYATMPAFDGVESFRAALLESEPHLERTGSPWLHVANWLIARTPAKRRARRTQCVPSRAGEVTA